MTVAEWLRTHTPPDAVIATQDIGVLAYFSDRRLIDMAGLPTRQLCLSCTSRRKWQRTSGSTEATTS